MSFVTNLSYLVIIVFIQCLKVCVNFVALIARIVYPVKRGPSEKTSNTGPTVYLNGLSNLGNTCFANSSLQVLYSMEEFREYLEKTKCVKPIHRSLSNLFRTINLNRRQEPVKPTDFMKTFSERIPEFGDRRQHDAHEFIRFLIDSIHEEFKATGNRSKVRDDPLNRLFSGQFKSSIECTECKNRNENLEEFWDISLALPPNEKDCDLKQCLKSYTNSEILETKSKCNSCQQITQFSKKLIFDSNSLPTVLMIHLKKFGNDGRKISKDVNICEELKIKEIDYHLVAFISHRGSSSSSGHYTSHCKHYGRWVRFDDQNVVILPHIGSRDMTGAYILFYQKSNHK